MYRKEKGICQSRWNGSARVCAALCGECLLSKKGSTAMARYFDQVHPEITRCPDREETTISPAHLPAGVVGALASSFHKQVVRLWKIGTQFGGVSFELRRAALFSNEGAKHRPVLVSAKIWHCQNFQAGHLLSKGARLNFAAFLHGSCSHFSSGCRGGWLLRFLCWLGPLTALN